jgi:nitroreductase / dihydropteridine reductase
MTLIEKLNWRYAAKRYDTTKTVPKETVARIVEAVRLAASSSGLQPYELLVISNKELREKIRPVANNQLQIVECSHLFIFAAWDTYTEKRINDCFDMTEEIRNFRSEAGTAYRQMLLKNFTTRDPEINYHHASKQAYIGLGTALIAAADEGLDATPMEGFNASGLDELLNLKEKGLRSSVLMALGYRNAEEDWLLKLKKVRRPSESFVTWME